MSDILVEQTETETQKLAKRELPSIIEALDVIACHNSEKNPEIAKETSEKISQIMINGRIEEPRLVGLVVNQLLKSARTYTDQFMVHMIDLASGMVFFHHLKKFFYFLTDTSKNRSDAVEIRVDTLAQIRLWPSFESSLVSVKES